MLAAALGCQPSSHQRRATCHHWQVRPHSRIKWLTFLSRNDGKMGNLPSETSWHRLATSALGIGHCDYCSDIVLSSVRPNTAQLRLPLSKLNSAGETPSHFAMLTGPVDARSMIRRLDRTPDVALLCINDDIAIAHDEASAVLRTWETVRWPHRAAWEL